MEIIFEALVETSYGAIILGAFLIIAILIIFFSKDSKD